ncbi:type I-B CRISPR-associated protein Cas8b1/Cst1 [Spirosoma soli]|uniref:Type I-B CRISPR-associated protein Cas8b1/Cst1 n=1 Tax=Spirosoma soli TaxID=1770529 RepID=A0ABW5M097_9BACT
MAILLEPFDTTSYTQPTGDPFADVGGYVIAYLIQHDAYKHLSLLELIGKVTAIYVYKWDAKLNALFLNSTITQGAFDSNRKVSETVNYFEKLLSDDLIGKEGYCRISGQHTRLYKAGRDNHILSGSGTFVNFYASFEPGLYLSKEVIIQIFFVALGVVKLSDKIALIYSNNQSVTEFFVRENCRRNLLNLTSAPEPGLLSSEFTNPANALFGFAEQCISKMPDALAFNEESGIEGKDTDLNLLHFTNFGAGPTIDLYALPTNIFRFYASCLTIHNREDWQRFVRSYYSSSKFKTAKYRPNADAWIDDKGNAVEQDTYKNWRNRIYQKLLEGKPLHDEFIRWLWKRKQPLRFAIIEKYQLLIRNMEKRTLEKIKQLADFITVSRSEDDILKDVTKLNGCKNPNDVRQLLLRLVKRNYDANAKEPILTVEDYAYYLFPDGIGWKEIRDVLLIAVYQKMHELNLLGLDTGETDDEEQSDETNNQNEA